VTLFGGLSRGDLEIFVRALAENQYLRVLAEPNLVALSGAEASFLAGGEVPIPVVQGGGTGGGAGSISIQFKPFGISLKFRPTVLGDGGIRLEVASEVSEVSDTIETATQIGPVRTPAFLTRRAETTLEMKSGQSFAMAGLLSERTNSVASKVPLLGDLPILGTLFRSIQFKKGETELLLIVTANLVEPISDLSLPPLPGEAYVEPTDWEFYVEGRIEGRVPARVAAEDQEWMKQMGLDRLKGPGAWMTYGQPPAASTARANQRGPAPAASDPKQ
jgi:pilus assembly protein CpaC